MPAHLFTPLEIGGVTFRNRIAVSPMCQYSAADGSATDWHVQHWMRLAMSGAGMVTIEATGVERRGRITHGCLGLYSDENEAAAKRTLDAARRVAPSGTLFRHSARACRPKGLGQISLGGRQAADADEDAWQTVAPSAIPFDDGWHVPEALDHDGIARVTSAFVAGGKARRARRLRLRRDPWRARLSAARVPLPVLQQAGRPLRRTARKPHAADP